MAGIISSSEHNQDQIIDSTKPGFQSTYKKPEPKEKQQRDENIKTGKKLFEDTIKNTEKPDKQQIIDAANLVRNLLKKGMKSRQSKYLKQPHLLFFRYNAKGKDKVWDQSPMALTLSASSTHMLAINLHWCPVQMRIAFINIILNANKSQISRNQPLNIKYQTLKSLIFSMKMQPCIRCYIINRISTRVAPVPYEYWLQAVKLQSDSFIGGISSEQAYAKAIREYTSRRRR